MTKQKFLPTIFPIILFALLFQACASTTILPDQNQVDGIQKISFLLEGEEKFLVHHSAFKGTDTGGVLQVVNNGLNLGGAQLGLLPVLVIAGAMVASESGKLNVDQKQADKMMEAIKGFSCKKRVATSFSETIKTGGPDKKVVFMESGESPPEAGAGIEVKIKDYGIKLVKRRPSHEKKTPPPLSGSVVKRERTAEGKVMAKKQEAPKQPEQEPAEEFMAPYVAFSVELKKKSGAVIWEEKGNIFEGELRLLSDYLNNNHFLLQDVEAACSKTGRYFAKALLFPRENSFAN